MEVIADKKVQNLPFDKTVLCTITEVIDEEAGIYNVSYSVNNSTTSSFTAYAQEGDSYQKDDSVYVNIPQNDIANQKTILRKYVKQQDTPINYVSPLEKYIKVKDIDINNNQIFKLRANDQDHSSVLILNKTYEDLDDMPNKFDCIGVSALFETLLDEYSPISGIYGLQFEITGLKPGWDTDQDNLENYFIQKVETFTNQDMYGMPYSFLSWTNQEKLINLKDFDYPIYNIKITFFEDNNFFDEKHNPIPTVLQIENGYDHDDHGVETIYTSTINLNENLLMKDLYVNFGYLFENVEVNDLILYTTSNIKYAEETDAINPKNLKLRWIVESGSGTEDNLFSIDNISDKEDEFWLNKTIYLYKYTYGKSEDDIYAGPFWDRVISWNWIKNEENNEISLIPMDLTITDTYNGDYEEVNLSNPFELILPISNADKKSAFIRYKMIIVEVNQVSDEEEIKEETSIYESNVISFENRDEVPSAVTMALIRGLKLICTDESNGVYRIYGEDNKIATQINSREMRLEANFEAIDILGLNTGRTELIWYYPKNNTMLLEPVDKGEKIWLRSSEDINNNSDISADLRDKLQAEIGNNYILYKVLDVSEYGEVDAVNQLNNDIEYTISSFYSSLKNNNIIRCEILRYGRIYEAEMDFFFGHQGNSGTNYAFDISLERKYERTIKNPGVEPENYEYEFKPVSAIVTPFLSLGDLSDGRDLWVKVKPTLIYGQEEITDLNNINWSWYCLSEHLDERGYNEPDIMLSTTQGSELYIKYAGNDIENYYAILQANIPRDIDENSSVVLTAYLPIGLSNGDITLYDGGNAIIYNEYGADPFYTEGEYKIYNDSGKIENVIWGVKSQENIDVLDNFYPIMLRDNDNRWFLQPTSMYFSNLENDICIFACQRNGSEITILFVQPLLIIQNAYGNQTLNQWDGSLQVNDENNYILSAMIGAGVKSENNTFSGVLMGKIQQANKDAITGLYGYKEGLLTYGFNEDGTAFIGPSGNGRIEFDGEHGIIQGGYLGEEDDIPIYNTTINLSDGQIDCTKFKLFATEDEDEDELNYYIKMTSDLTKEIVGQDDQGNDISDFVYNPLEIGKKFSVEWDGTLHASGAIIGNVFDNSHEVSQNSTSTIEDLLLGMYINYVDRDNVEAIRREEGDVFEASERMAADVFEATERMAADLLEARMRLDLEGQLDEAIIKEQQERIAALQPTNLYDSMIDTVNIGNQGYFLVTNKTYGESTSQTEFLIDDAKHGTLVAKNLIATGLVNAFAGQFGGWNLLPGLMHYGYNTQAIITDKIVWTGDFFNSIKTRPKYDSENNLIDYNKLVNIEDEITHEIIQGKFEDTLTNKGWSSTQSLSAISNLTEILNNQQVKYEVNNPVEVGDTKAFIYLGDGGNGINIKKFGNNYLDTNAFGTEIIPRNNDINKGYLQNIIFSLGSNFAVDKTGSLFANSGSFSGTINSKEGNIGGWIITNKGISNRVLFNSEGEYQRPAANANPNYTVWLIPEGQDITYSKHRDIYENNNYDWWPKDNDGPIDLEDIVFRLGNEFFVDKHGQVYAGRGTFSGTIISTEGNIGGWNISKEGISYSDSSGNKIIGLYSKAYHESKPITGYDENDQPIYGETTSVLGNLRNKDTVLQINDNFKVDYEGNLIANGATITGVVNATTLTIGENDDASDVDDYIGDLVNSTEFNDILVKINGLIQEKEVFKQAKDGSGNLLFDEYGNPIYVQARDENNNLLFDEYGNPIYEKEKVGSQTEIDYDPNSYNQNTTGTAFRISSKGLLTAKNAIITGNIYATGGWIGGWTIYDGYLGTERASETGFDCTIGGESYSYASAMRGGNTFFTAKSSGLKGPESLLTNFKILPNNEPYFLLNVGNKFAVTTGGIAYMTGAKISGVINATTLTIGANDNAEDVDDYIGDLVKSSEFDDIIVRINGLIQEKEVFKQAKDGSGNLLFDSYGNPIYVQARDGNGNLLFDDYGNPIYEKEKVGSQSNTDSDQNYTQSATGTAFRVSSKGLLTAKNAIITGNIYATGGWIGGWNIYNGYLGREQAQTVTETIYSDGVGQEVTVNQGGSTFLAAGTGLKGSNDLVNNFGLMGADNLLASTPSFLFNVGNNFAVTTSGTAYMKGAKISGTIEATGGSFGGWKINRNSISAENTDTGTKIVLSSSGRIALTKSETLEDDYGNEYFQTKSGITIDANAETITLQDIDIKSGTIGPRTLLAGENGYLRDDYGNIVYDETSGEPKLIDESATTISVIANNGLLAVKKDSPLYKTTTVGEGESAQVKDEYRFKVSRDGQLTCAGATIKSGYGLTGNLIQAIDDNTGTTLFKVTHQGIMECTGAKIKSDGTTDGANLIEGYEGNTLVFKVTQKGKLIATSAEITGDIKSGSKITGAEITGGTITGNVFRRSNISPQSFNTLSSMTWDGTNFSYGSGLIINFGSQIYGTWSNGIFTSMTGWNNNTNEAIKFDYDTNGETNNTNHMSYMGFLRGTGNKAVLPGQVFLGLAYSDIAKSFDLTKTGELWTINDKNDSFADKYSAWIKFCGQARFWSLSIGGAGSSVIDISGDCYGIKHDGTAYFNGSASDTATTTSDERLKENFNTNLNLNFYDELCPKSYNFINNKEVLSFGLIAQDVQKLLDKYNFKETDFIHTRENMNNPLLPDGKQYFLNYNNFHAFHIAKNHQQDERIKQLEDQVKDLSLQIEQLKREKGVE